MHHRTAFALVVLLPLLGSCATAPTTPTRPPGQPPTPKTITPAHPGGDAADAESAALDRLVSETWGTKRDRWKTLHVPLADWKNWRRVRLWGQPTRATYRYGDDHYAVTSIWYQRTEGKDDPDACLAKFLDLTVPIAKSFDVKLGAPKVTRSSQSIDGEERPMLIEVVDGAVESLFSSDEYVGAVVAYQSWPGTCLVQGFAVVAGKHRDLAERVRDRWVAEGAAQLRWEKNLKDA